MRDRETHLPRLVTKVTTEGDLGREVREGMLLVYKGSHLVLRVRVRWRMWLRPKSLDRKLVAPIYPAKRVLHQVLHATIIFGKYIVPSLLSVLGAYSTHI